MNVSYSNGITQIDRSAYALTVRRKNKGMGWQRYVTWDGYFRRGCVQLNYQHGEHGAKETKTRIIRTMVEYEAVLLDTECTQTGADDVVVRRLVITMGKTICVVDKATASQTEIPKDSRARYSQSRGVFQAHFPAIQHIIHNLVLPKQLDVFSASSYGLGDVFLRVPPGAGDATVCR